jgi:hypothetical protein
VAEYEALINGLRIAIELGVRRLDARGNSQLVIDQVMKNSHCRDSKMQAYCDEVRRLEDKFYGLEFNHIARRYNETADELAKIASGRTTVPPDVFSRDLHQPSVKIDGPPEPEVPSARPEAPLKGKCALGPFLSILVIECQLKCLNVNLCPWMNKVQIKS